MIGYWKGGRRPFTTTGNNFLENFNFFTPIAGGLFWFLAIGIPLVMINNVINPTNTYKFQDYHHDLTIEYQTSGDDVTGKIAYYWDEDGNNYHIETEFKGKVNGNDLMIELDDNNIRTYVGPKGNINKNLILNNSGNQIYFQGLNAKQI
jgi:hypothetical protein